MKLKNYKVALQLHVYIVEMWVMASRAEWALSLANISSLAAMWTIFFKCMISRNCCGIHISLDIIVFLFYVRNAFDQLYVYVIW